MVAKNICSGLGAVGVIALAAFSPGWQLPSVCAQTSAAGHYDSSEAKGPVGTVIPVTDLGKAALALQMKEVEKKLLPLQLTTQGKIEAIPTREFAQHSPVSGRVSEVLVNPGDVVRQGQILLQLESPELNKLAADIIQSQQDIDAQIAQQQAVLDDEVNQGQARIQLAQETYNRDCKLYDERIGSQKQMQTSLAALEMAKSSYKTSTQKRDLVLRALRTKLRLTLEPLRQRLEIMGTTDSGVKQMLSSGKTVTMAPVKSARSGVVTDIGASAGQSVDPSVKLVSICDLSRVWATAQIYEDDMGRIKVGQKVSVRVAAYEGELFQGTLSYIGSSVDALTRTLPVRAELANPDNKLKPDMYADLIIQMGQPSLAIMLPQEAVVERNGHTLAFVEVKGGFQPVRVTLGRSFGDLVEITEGLSIGQKVVTQGAFQLAAEMQKNSGDTSMFQQVTEGEREAVEAPAAASNPLTWQLLLVGVIVAFVMGFMLSLLGGRIKRGKSAQPDPAPGGKERLDGGEPGIPRTREKS